MTNEELAAIVKPYTMASPARVQLLIGLAKLANEQEIPGDFVECGVCNGGSAAILGHFAAKTGRKTHLFDSWQGLPPTTKEDLPSANGNTAESEVGKCLGDLDKVKEVFQAVGAHVGLTYVHAGWFNETFPVSAPQIDKIAMLNLDSDWYESEKLCLETWYDKVSPGGFIYFDDFFYWPGCRQAANEFFWNRGIKQVFRQTEHSAWMIKGNVR